MAKSLERQKNRIEIPTCVLIFAMAIVSLVPTHAQEAGGTIVGTVTDPSGAAVANANMTIRNVATGVERTVPTNADGLYAVPNLVPASYEIKVDAAGFASTVVSDVVLTVGERREINVSLKVGQASDSVRVEGAEISDIQLASSSVGNVVDSHTVVELPLNGRDWTSLTLLEPGVAQVRTQKALGVSNDRPNRGLGVDVTIGGNRPQGNDYRLDGVNINDYSSGAPGSITGAVLGVDAVQEFSVVTSNATADYGRTSGGAVNAASRSGTNSFHGSAYEFLRNSALDARNFFDKATIPPFKRNQFGGSASGPIIKDHTFFFADYEGLRQSLSSTNPIVVPSQNARSGILAVCSQNPPPIPNPCTGNHLTVFPGRTDANGVDLLVGPFLACSASSCLFPLPNGAVSGDTGIFNFVAKQATSEDFVTTRMDHRISASDSLFGTYVFDRGQIANPDAYNIKNVGNQSRRQTLALEESHILSPTLLNSARFGFNRNVVIAFSTLSAINPAASNTAFGFNPGEDAGIITVGSGVTQFSGGLGAISEYHFHYNSFQFYDDLYWTRNKHSLKFGFSVERIQSNQFTRGSSPNGFYTFGSLQSFLTNQPTNYVSLLGSAISPRDLRQTLFGGYVQDDYKFRPNLTLNLGVRYEMATVPTETANRLSTLVNLTDTAPKLGSPYFSNPTLRNFSPRVGFAWDPTGKGKTSVHGAYGIYDVLPLPYEFELLTLLSAPFTLGGSFTFPTSGTQACNAPGVHCFPTGGFPNLTVKTLRFGYVEQNPHRSYVQQWTLNIQREVFRNFTVTAAYVGSRGIHLPDHTDDINDMQPVAKTQEGYLWPTVIGSGARLFPNLGGQVSANTWSAESTYHGLELQGIKRLSHGFQLQGSYTFSKSIDTSSSGIAGDTFGNSVSSLPFFDPRLRRGLSDFDVRHVGVINAIWNVPGPGSWNGPAKWVATGWQLGEIVTLTSGLPFTPIIGGDPLGLQAADNYAFPDRMPSCNPVNSNFKNGGLHYLNLGCFALPPQATDIAAQCRTFGFIAASASNPGNPGIPNTCANLLGNSGRNSVIGPGLKDFDFSLYKNNRIPRISETFNVQFRWEIFNIFNHANFNPPPPAARQIFTAAGALNTNTAGVLAGPTATSSRQMQFALKFIW
jgi:outer membrane receptor protein involved in Fe transport